MNEIQNYLKDLLMVDCKIQTNLQCLLLVTSCDALEAKSKEIKSELTEFKNILNEMKDFCDSFSSIENQNKNSILRKLTRSSNESNKNSSSDYNSESFSSSPKDILDSEYKIQKDHLASIESRFRTTYLHAQQKINQQERETLLKNDLKSNGSLDLKKRNLNNQTVLKETNQITDKLSKINRQLKWTENQTSDIIPVLDESSKLLKNTSQEFGYMKTVINDGKRLLIRLSRREFTDKLLIVLCLVFFLLVCLYICWKRLF
jgi:hypothetical protein